VLLRTVLLVLLALVLPAQGAGHAGARSVEADGDTLIVVLSSAAEEAFLTADGADVALDPADDHVLLVTPRADGPATTAVRVLSTDGHVSRLHIDRDGVRANATVDPPVLIAGRALVIAGLVVMLGVVGMIVVVAVPAIRTPIRPPGEGDRRLAALDGTRDTPGLAPLLRIHLTAGVLGLVGVVLVVTATAVRLDAGAGDLGTLLLDTRLGRAALGQVVLIALALAVGLVLRGRDPRPWWGWALAAPPALGALLVSMSGHAMSGNDRVLSVALDAVHMVATALWFGGLVALLCAVVVLRRTTEARSALPTLAAVVVRFSAVALIAVGVLVVTGVYRALAELGDLGDLVETDYGIALLVKLGVFGLMLGMGAYNRFVVHPRLERAALDLAPDDRGAAAALRVSVRVELVLAAALIVAVAVLVSMPPP